MGHPFACRTHLGRGFAPALLWRGACLYDQFVFQIPLAEVYNDARRNVIVAIIIAGNQEIPEVCLFFCDRLLRANRAVKVDRFVTWLTP